MLDGIIEIRKSSDNQVIKTGYEDGKLLKLKGSSARVQNYAYLSQHGEGNCHQVYCGMKDLVI